MTPADRYLAYLRRVELHVAADPWAFYARVERGLALLKTGFPWPKEVTPAAGPPVLPYRRVGGGKVYPFVRKHA